MATYMNVCGNCNISNNILWFCNKCPMSLCQECKGRHVLSPMTKHHVVTPLYCEIHSGKLRNFYCHDCCQTSCESCLFDGHYGHSVVISFLETPERNSRTHENAQRGNQRGSASPLVRNGQLDEYVSVNFNGRSTRYIPSTNYQVFHTNILSYMIFCWKRLLTTYKIWNKENKKGRDLMQSSLWQTSLNDPWQRKVKVTKRRYKTFDYTKITDRLRTVRRSDKNHPTDMVNIGLKIQPFNFQQRLCNQMDINLDSKPIALSEQSTLWEAFSIFVPADFQHIDVWLRFVSLKCS